MHAFWASSSNVYQIEQFFTRYLIACNGFCDTGTPIYLGGLGEEGVTVVLLQNGVKEEISSLQSAVEEDDERLLLHGHHAIGEHIERTVITS